MFQLGSLKTFDACVHPSDPDLIGLEYGPSIRTFKSCPRYCEIQQELRITALGHK